MTQASVKNPADANHATRAFYDAIQIEERLVGALLPSLKTRVLGREFDTPVMMPAFSHLDKGKGRNPLAEMAVAAKNLNAVNWVGMCEDNEFAEIQAAGAATARIIKPFADHDVILRQIAFAKEHGAFAVGMDIDHVFGDDGGYDVVDGIPMGPQTAEDLTAYVKAAGETPFIVKGVLSVRDAIACRDAGVRGIVVSHHHGRMPFAIAPPALLPEIRAALKGSGVEIYVDCGIASGSDVFKALALGADAVSTGRAILAPLMKEGSAGVENTIAAMNRELSMMMGYTGSPDTASIDPSVLHY